MIEHDQLPAFFKGNPHSFCIYPLGKHMLIMHGAECSPKILDEIKAVGAKTAIEVLEILRRITKEQHKLICESKAIYGKEGYCYK